MNKYIKLFGNITTIIGGATKLLELLKVPDAISNPAVKEVLGHLQWLGNVCWYVGIPVTIIYLFRKLRDLEANYENFKAVDYENFKDQTFRSIESKDQWATGQINELRKMVRQN